MEITNNKSKTFLINRSEIRERFDPLYFKTIGSLSIIKETTFEVRKLSEVINMQRGRFGHRPRNDPRFYSGNYPFIQTGDIVKASLTGKRIQYSQTLNDLGLKTSRLFQPDVMIITIAANIGDTAILDYPACFPDSLIAISPKNARQLLLKYINVYFKLLKNYLNDIAPQSAQKNINYQQLAPTPIVVPPISIQEEVIEIHENAYREKQFKEEQADELLRSIDLYLLDELKITLPIKNNDAKSRMFYSNLSSVTNGRLDPDYQNISYQHILDEIKKSKYQVTKLKDVTDVLSSGKTPSSAEYADEATNFPIIKVGSYTNDFINLEKVDYVVSKQRLKARNGDIFILSAAHQSEYVGRHIKMLVEEPSIDTSYVGELYALERTIK